ncbi:MAG: hypothetical protein S4CHLAM37_15030 [Chlamydiia bacterium]|nr:hypothetical protein [Chlamydiia bacterium]
MRELASGIGQGNVLAAGLGAREQLEDKDSKVELTEQEVKTSSAATPAIQATVSTEDSKELPQLTKESLAAHDLKHSTEDIVSLRQAQYLSDQESLVCACEKEAGSAEDGFVEELELDGMQYAHPYEQYAGSGFSYENRQDKKAGYDPKMPESEKEALARLPDELDDKPEKYAFYETIPSPHTTNPAKASLSQMSIYLKWCVAKGKPEKAIKAYDTYRKTLMAKPEKEKMLAEEVLSFAVSASGDLKLLRHVSQVLYSDFLVEMREKRKEGVSIEVLEDLISDFESSKVITSLPDYEKRAFLSMLEVPRKELEKIRNKDLIRTTQLNEKESKADLPTLSTPRKAYELGNGYRSFLRSYNEYRSVKKQIEKLVEEEAHAKGPELLAILNEQIIELESKERSISQVLEAYFTSDDFKKLSPDAKEFMIYTFVQKLKEDYKSSKQLKRIVWLTIRLFHEAIKPKTELKEKTTKLGFHEEIEEMHEIPTREEIQKVYLHEGEFKADKAKVAADKTPGKGILKKST